MVTPRIIGIMLIAASLLLVTTGYQNAMASVVDQVDGGIVIDETPGTDVLVEEAAEAGNMTGVNFMSIQNAQSGSISEINATAYTLELSNVSDKTILFSDRPDRIVTSVSTADFVGNWTAGQDSFAADHPNAVLVVVGDIAEEEEDTTLVELLKPTYDNDTKTLNYEARALNATGIDMPSEFGQATLIIDARLDGLILN